MPSARFSAPAIWAPLSPPSVAPLGDTALSLAVAGMSAGQWLELSTLGLSTALFIAGATNTLDYCDKGVYDPINRQVRLIGQAHLEDQRWHQYDEATNTWSNLADPPWDDGGSGQPSYIGHGYQHNAVDPATGDQYYRRYNSSDVRRLTRSSNTWGQTAAAPNTEIAGGLEWLPTIGSQGGLVLHIGTSVHRWDKAGDSWTTPANGTLTGQAYHCVAVRSVPNGVVLFGGGNGSAKLWKVNGSGTVTACADCPITFGIGQTITTADPVSGDLLVIASNSVAHKYSVAGNSWSALSMTGAPSFGTVGSGSRIIAVPMPAYGAILFLFGATPAVWLYKHA